VFEVREKPASPPLRTASRMARFSPVVMVLLDCGLVYVAFLLAYQLRYTLKLGPEIRAQMTLGNYRPLAAMLLALMIPTLMVKGGYGSRLGRELLDEAITVFSAATVTMGAIVVITTMIHQWDWSRGLMVYLWVLVIILLVSGRAIYRLAQAALYRRGVGVRRLLVVGANDVARMVMQSVMQRPDLGYQLAGFVGDRGFPLLQDFGRFRALGTVDDIPDMVEAGQIDEIIVALPASAHEEIAPILGICERHGVGLKLIPDLFEMSLGRVRIDELAGIPLLDVKDRALRRLERAAKRAVDIVVAAVLMIITLPLVLVISTLIRLESGGPTLLQQTRVGVGGKKFHCLKFRTMRRDALEIQKSLDEFNEADGPLFKMRNDPRCTAVGRRLRQWSLDELPQIWNVLVGDMSLVGPRPPLPEEVARYDARQVRRLEVKPGMTGIWQVNGRSDLGFDEMITMDLYYVQNWTLILDIKILSRTIVAVLRRHGAY
jgi:exopolysaccharide biosynthesis polyprenyl glycosylphosphotransferase